MSSGSNPDLASLEQYNHEHDFPSLTPRLFPFKMERPVRLKRSCSVGFCLCAMSQTGKSTETESELVTSKRGQGKKRAVTATGHGDTAGMVAPSELSA